MKAAVRKPSIWGDRRARMRPAIVVIDEAKNDIEWLNSRTPQPHLSLSNLRGAFMHSARSYFALAAMTRRHQLAPEDRSAGLEQLFKMRALLEKTLLNELRANMSNLPVMAEATSDSFFGKSKKQGVSVRYALASCVPTVRCGGLCYAHDGRDREFLQIYRGVLNFMVGDTFEKASISTREALLHSMGKAIDNSVEAALKDQQVAAADGFNRRPRIRFSHVGEMASTPNFTNALAREVKDRDSRIQCVVYTRHPMASMLDTSLLVVNFTLEGKHDRRVRHAPSGARIVNSSWDGRLNEEAEVNFLEHHVDRIVTPKGSGSICPVTIEHKTKPSCDLAHCEKCFVPAGR